MCAVPIVLPEAGAGVAVGYGEFPPTPCYSRLEKHKHPLAALHGAAQYSMWFGVAQ